eukprot:158432_1
MRIFFSWLSPGFAVGPTVSRQRIACNSETHGLYNFVTAAIRHPQQHSFMSSASIAASPFSSPTTLRSSSLEGATTPSSLEALANYLNSPTQIIKGVGDRTAYALVRMRIYTIKDMLMHMPIGVNVRRIGSVSSARDGDTLTTVVSLTQLVENTEPFSKKPHRATCRDNQGGELDLLFFFAGRSPRAANFWEGVKGHKRKLLDNAQVLVSGRVQWSTYTERLEMVHPELIEPVGSLPEDWAAEPLYRLTEGISKTKLKDLIQKTLSMLREMSVGIDPPVGVGWLPEIEASQCGWPGLMDAFIELHSPKSNTDIDPLSPARSRLAFDELLAQRLRTTLSRNMTSNVVIDEPGGLTRTQVEELEYDLTSSQKQALKDILLDLQGGTGRMIRLLQGDVGSGKTIVSWLAMLAVIDSKAGGQACLLAPTELLAFQHYTSFSKLAKGLRKKARGSRKDAISCKNLDEDDIRVEILTGSTNKKRRDDILQRLKAGEIDVLVGTHALYGNDVEFCQLGLAVVDEEQRFGVKQRQKLTGDVMDTNSEYPHILYLSATPIPRSLALTCFGGIDVSELHEMPRGTKHVETILVDLAEVNHVAKRVKAFVDNTTPLDGGEGHSIQRRMKVFWVLPLIEPGEAPDQCSGAKTRYEALCGLLGQENVSLLHGKMTSDEKANALGKFVSGNASVLVATNIIEVGIDVPDANICVIENAERFGLSQLHQIRGRIGRAMSPGDRCHCVLVHSSSCSLEGITRLETLKTISDGFDIAAIDMQLRGPGQILGVHQKGFFNDFKIADLVQHKHLILLAHKKAVELAQSRGTILPDVKEFLLPVFTHDTAGQFELLGATDIVKERRGMNEKTIKQRSPSELQMWTPIDLTSMRNSIVLLDVETTGLNAKVDRVLQLAAKKLNSVEERHAFNYWIEPSGHQGPLGSNIHGITSSILRKNNAEPFAIVWPKFESWLKGVQEEEGTEGVVVCCHNALFDFRFLMAEYRRYIKDLKLQNGMRFKKPTLGVAGISGLVDTLSVMRDKRVWKTLDEDGNTALAYTRPKSYKLSSLYETLFHKKLEGAHDAAADVDALEAVLTHELIASTWRTIASEKTKQIPVVPMPPKAV